MDKQNTMDVSEDDECTTNAWYKYEDKCIKEFVIEWLKSNNIELKYLN